MIIHAYILCYNEEDILPFTLDYYSQHCDKIYLLDNQSTDKSVEIASRYPKVQILSWSSNNTFDEIIQTTIRNTAYKMSRGIADWVIVCDCDEFLYGLDMLPQFKQDLIQQAKVEGYLMVSEDFPKYDGRLITEILQRGSRFNPDNKQVVFDPNIDITFSFGCHHYKTKIDYKKSEIPIKLLHYRLLGKNHILNRAKRGRSRVPKAHVEAKINTHYFMEDQELLNFYYDFLNKSSKVI